MHYLVWLGTVDRSKERAREPVASPLPSRVRGKEVASFSSVDRRVSLEAQPPLVKLLSPGRKRGLCKLRLLREVPSIPAPSEGMDSTTL